MPGARFIAVHGHFYQPPRENPWLEAVETQDSAHPYHDWNERVTAECYAPNARSRVLDDKGRIEEIVCNYDWLNFDFGPTEFLDAGDYVFVGVALNGRGRDSGVEVRMEGWQVWLIRGERAARCEEYLDRAEALEAAGLSEQDAHVESP